MKKALDLRRDARKGLRRAPTGTAARIESILRAFATGNPPANADIVAMQGATGTYRLRVGEWRAIFRVTEDSVIVERIAPRGAAYK